MFNKYFKIVVFFFGVSGCTYKGGEDAVFKDFDVTQPQVFVDSTSDDITNYNAVIIFSAEGEVDGDFILERGMYGETKNNFKLTEILNADSLSYKTYEYGKVEVKKGLIRHKFRGDFYGPKAGKAWIKYTPVNVTKGNLVIKSHIL